ncbi:MAG: hypothetical protein NTZ32_17050 [Planctomycetales bacterium]|nr:hypothetical protein [Planctomycetales bacterium]
MADDLPQLDIPELRTAFLFRRRPVAIPGDLRPAWRIGLVVLLLKNCCKSGRSSLARLHVLSWGFLSADGRHQLQAAVEGRLSPDALVVRFEPFLVQAVDYAIGEGLVRRAGGNKIELTPSGKTLAEEIDATEETYVAEKQFMSIVRTKVTEDLVNRMFGWEKQA